MKPKKSNLLLQRQVLEKKLSPWMKLAQERTPATGWIKAIRGALGMTTKQLAERMNLEQPNIMALEQREARGAVTLDSLEKAARAMDCKLIYALVPNDHYLSLDDILNRRAETVAKELMKKVSHSMSLESQEVGLEDKREQLLRIAKNLKETVDSRLWSKK